MIRAFIIINYRLTNQLLAILQGEYLIYMYRKQNHIYDHINSYMKILAKYIKDV